VSGPIFADAFFFIGLLNSRDQHHEQVLDAAREYRGIRLVTTDWVLLETADALCTSPVLRRLAGQVIRAALAGGSMMVVAATPQRWQKALAFYELHSDKHWGLTDCLSFIVMRDNGITKALTGDHHFVQAGFEALILP
jgi:predicted nucleic acid-binding protein